MKQEEYERILEIICEISLCHFSEYEFFSISLKSHEPMGRVYIQVEMLDRVGNRRGRGSKHDLSEHMTETEIVQRVFKAVLTYMEFEIRKNFNYEGVPVFHPHTSVRSLMEARELETRHDAAQETN